MIKPSKTQTAWSDLDTDIFQRVWIFLNEKV